MNILETLFGSSPKQGSTFSKGQQSTIDEILQSIKGMKGGAQDITQNQGFQSGQNWLESLFNDPQFFQNFEAPLQRDFQERTIPELANRFASMGSGGSTGSTAFRNALGREGSNLSTNIGALRGGLQQQGVNQALQYGQQPFQNLMQLLQTGLQPTQNTMTQPTGGLFGPLFGALGGGASAGYGQQWGQNMYGNSGQHPGTY